MGSGLLIADLGVEFKKYFANFTYLYVAFKSRDVFLQREASDV